MPVTKTAKRALRSSKRKSQVNKRRKSRLEMAIRKAEKTKKEEDIKDAISLCDKASKWGIIHENKAARIKSRISKLKKTSK